MEKICVNQSILDLIPMGIQSSEKQRVFTVKSGLSHLEIEQLFSDISKIEYLSEAGETLVTYLDGIRLTAISKNYDDGTYTITISIDAVERQLKDLQSQIDILKASS